MFKKDKDVKLETVEEALDRGLQVEKGDSVMPNSFVFPDKYGMQRRRRRSKYKSTSDKVDVKKLLARCNPEQKKKLMVILEKQGIKL